MGKSRIILRDIIVSAAYLLWLLSVTGFIVYVFSLDVHILFLPMGIWVAFFIFCWLIRMLAPAAFVFIPLHILAVVIAVFMLIYAPFTMLPLHLPLTGINIVIPTGLIFVIFSVLFSIIARFVKAGVFYGNGALLFFVITLVILCIWCEYRDVTAPVGFLVFSAVILLLLRLAFLQIYSIDHSLEIITRTSAQPVGHIRIYTNRLVLFFTVFALIAALVAFSLFTVGGGVYATIGNFFRRLAGFFDSLGSPDMEGFYSQTGQGGGGADMGLPEDVEPWPLWIRALIYFIIFAPVVVAMFFIANYLLENLSRIFGFRFRKRRARHVAPGDISESVLPPLKTVRERFSLLNLGPANRIRRQFYKKLRKYKKNTPLSVSDTAWELAGKIKPKENIDSLTAMYETVRYTEE
jgi:hypothetical protein